MFEGVIGALCAHADRTFAFGDAFFLVTWLRRVGARPPAAACVAAGHATWRAALGALAAQRRVELVGGGWASPDELLSPPDGVLLAFATGLDALSTELPHAPRPRVAWQIDPFGHGAPTPPALRALNFSAVALNRVPFRTRARARGARSLDFLWRASPHTRDAAALQAHILFEHYASPRGLDVTRLTAALSAAEASAWAASESLARDLRRRADASASGHVLLLVGDDFRYSANAAPALASLDALLAAFAAAEEGRSGAPRLRYSTPSAFFDAVAAAETAAAPLPRREGAFAPYADAALSAENTWAGAYGARPGVKAAAWGAVSLARAGF
jgi:hypothetical protein